MGRPRPAAPRHRIARSQGKQHAAPRLRPDDPRRCARWRSRPCCARRGLRRRRAGAIADRAVRCGARLRRELPRRPRAGRVGAVPRDAGRRAAAAERRRSRQAATLERRARRRSARLRTNTARRALRPPAALQPRQQRDHRAGRQGARSGARRSRHRRAGPDPARQRRPTSTCSRAQDTLATRARTRRRSPSSSPRRSATSRSARRRSPTRARRRPASTSRRRRRSPPRTTWRPSTSRSTSWSAAATSRRSRWQCRCAAGRVAPVDENGSNRADDEHPAVRGGAVALDIARLETEKARAAKLPTVDLVARGAAAAAARSAAGVQPATTAAAASACR